MSSKYPKDDVAYTKLNLEQPYYYLLADRAQPLDDEESVSQTEVLSTPRSHHSTPTRVTSVAVLSFRCAVRLSLQLPGARPSPDIVAQRAVALHVVLEKAIH